MISICIDIGGTRMKTALVSDGQIIESAVIPMDTSSGLIKQLPEIEKEIRRLAEIQQPEGVGIAYPGLVDPVKKKILSSNGKYLDGYKLDLADWVREKFSLPMILENDANAALLGETSFGCAAGSDNAVIMILGTGIGTAALINGELLRGKHFQAGCLGGHISINGLASGMSCNCGSVGCAEVTGSTWGMAQMVQKAPDFQSSALSQEDIIDFKILEKWDIAGDTLANRVMETCINAWCTCSVNLIHAYDPDMIILSGGVIRCGERIVQPIRENVAKHAWTPWGEVEIRIAQNPENSVLLGLHNLLMCTVEKNQ